MMQGRTALLNRTKTFHGALCVLDSLQSNAARLGRLRERLENPGLPLQTMQGFLHRTGIPVDELDKLKIIHVTGTKGKGSTCAFTERILRSHGFSTGFYSSPHLVHVRERIRISGRPIGKQLFTKYFWEAYERLEDTQDVHGRTMPFYFQLLTLLAFHVFLQERVDLAVIEVGIGGQYDCTNIVRKPWVCGISSLDLDHCSLLGDTAEDIAWQKAGIFKPGVQAFTVRQEPGPLRVLQDRATEVGCPLWVCPELDQYEDLVGPMKLGLAGKSHRLNAALALQLSNSWLQRYKAEEGEGGDGGDTTSWAQAPCRPGSEAAIFQPSATTLRGLQETEWLGRNQTLRRGSVTYYLDGAHTTASMQACVSWFTQETLNTENTRILLFNTTGERDSAALLALLLPCRFDFALFCPNITDTTVSSTDHQPALARCRENQSSWETLNVACASNQHCLHLVVGDGSRSTVFPCIPSALQWITQRQEVELGGSGRVSVLVTGSLYLVGGLLKHLEPSLDT